MKKGKKAKDMIWYDKLEPLTRIEYIVNKIDVFNIIDWLENSSFLVFVQQQQQNCYQKVIYFCYNLLIID